MERALTREELASACGMTLGELVTFEKDALVKKHDFDKLLAAQRERWNETRSICSKCKLRTNEAVNSGFTLCEACCTHDEIMIADDNDEGCVILSCKGCNRYMPTDEIQTHYVISRR